MHVMSITAPCFAIGVFEVRKAWISCVFFADSSQYAAAWVNLHPLQHCRWLFVEEGRHVVSVGQRLAG